MITDARISLLFTNPFNSSTDWTHITCIIWCEPWHTHAQWLERIRERIKIVWKRRQSVVFGWECLFMVWSIVCRFFIQFLSPTVTLTSHMEKGLRISGLFFPCSLRHHWIGIFWWAWHLRIVSVHIKSSIITLLLIHLTVESWHWI